MRLGSSRDRPSSVVRPPSSASSSIFYALVRPHHVDEAGKQIMAVARTGRGLGMILHREHRPVLERDAAVRAVEQRDVRLARVRRPAPPAGPGAAAYGGGVLLFPCGGAV